MFPKIKLTIADLFGVTLGLSLVIAAVRNWPKWHGIGSFFWVCMYSILACHLARQCQRLLTGDQLPFDSSEKRIRFRWFALRATGLVLLVANMVSPSGWFYFYPNLLADVEPTQLIAESVKYYLLTATGLFAFVVCLWPLYSTAKLEGNRVVEIAAGLAVATVCTMAFGLMLYGCMAINGLLQMAVAGIEIGMRHPAEMQFGMALETTASWSSSLRCFVEASYRDALLGTLVLAVLVCAFRATSKIWQGIFAIAWLSTLIGLSFAIEHTRVTVIPLMGGHLEDFYLIWPEDLSTWVLLFVPLFLASLLVVGQNNRECPRVELDRERLVGFHLPKWFLVVFLVGIFIESYLVTTFPSFPFFGNDSWFKASVVSPVGFSELNVIFTTLYALFATRQLFDLHINGKKRGTFYTSRNNWASIFARAFAVSVSLPPVAIAFGNLGFGSVLSGDSALTTLIVAVAQFHQSYKYLGVIAALVFVILLLYKIKFQKKGSSQDV